MMDSQGHDDCLTEHGADYKSAKGAISVLTGRCYANQSASEESDGRAEHATPNGTGY